MRACLFWCAIGLTATVAATQDISPFYDALSRETLAVNDGWAAFGAGTTGEFHPTQAVAGVVRNTAGTFREE